MLTTATLVAALAGLPAVAADPDPVRLVRLEVDVELVPDRSGIDETVRVTLAGAGASVVHFTLAERFRVEQAAASTGIVEYRHSGSRLRVVVDPPIVEPRTLTLRVRGRPTRGDDNRVTVDGAVLPADADWYPRLPSSGPFESTLRVRAPESWIVAAPGSVGRSDDGTWTFTSRSPVRELAVVAGPQLTASETARAGHTLRIVAPAGALDREAIADRLQDPLAWFSGTLMPYPFDGLTFVAAPFVAETVAASGFVAVPVGRAPLDRGSAAELIVGQWYGQWLAADGAWIDAFGAWHAWTYALDRGLDPPAELRRLRSDYLALRPTLDVALARSDAATPAAVVRGKGSAAVAMLRTAAGTRRFARILDAMMTTAPGRLDVARVRAILLAEAGESAVDVFEQWFERTGVPRLRLTMRVMPASDDRWRTDLRIEQLRGPYRLPVDVVFVGRGTQRRETITIDETGTDVYYVLPFRPVRLEVDPLGRLLQADPEVVVP